MGGDDTAAQGVGAAAQGGGAGGSGGLDQIMDVIKQALSAAMRMVQPLPGMMTSMMGAGGGAAGGGSA